MNLKIIAQFIIILMMILFSLNGRANDSHLEQAVQHTEAAAKATMPKSIVEHAEAAKAHAEAAKNEKNHLIPGGAHLDAGIRSLNKVIENGELGAADSARKAAEEALNHFKQAV
jgi:hypothetical protein